MFGKEKAQKKMMEEIITNFEAVSLGGSRREGGIERADRAALPSHVRQHLGTCGFRQPIPLMAPIPTFKT